MSGAGAGPAGRPARAPPDVDITRPSIARVHDHHLGGSHDVRIDREAADATLAAYPDMRPHYHAGRASPGYRGLGHRR